MRKISLPAPSFAAQSPASSTCKDWWEVTYTDTRDGREKQFVHANPRISVKRAIEEKSGEWTTAIVRFHRG